MTTPSPYAGLLEHMNRHLGEVTHAVPPDVNGHNRGFAIGYHRHASKDMVTAASTGVRFQEVAARLPEEFVCSARPDQEFEASYLVGVVAEAAVRRGRGYEYGGGYLNDEPLIPDSQVVGVVALPHFHMPDDFHIFRDESGESVLQIIGLVPVTLPEHEFMNEQRIQGLVARWREQGTDLLDIYRASAV